MRRRTVLALIAAAGVAPTSVRAAGASRSLSSTFPLLEGYLALPAGSRSLFNLAYRAVRRGRIDLGLRAAIVVRGQSVPIVLDRLGFVDRLPTLEDFDDGGEVVFDEEPQRFQLESRASVASSSRPDLALLGEALDQLNAATSRVAGAFAFMIPRLNSAFFPEAGNGRVTLPGGAVSALPTFPSPLDGPTPYVAPQRLPANAAVTLAQAPSRITLGVPRASR